MRGDSIDVRYELPGFRVLLRGREEFASANNVHSNEFRRLRSSLQERRAVQRAFKIGEDVPPIFDADTDTDKAVDDAGQLQFLLADGGMRGGSRMAYQRFHAAQAHGVPGHLEVAEEFEGGWFPSL